MTTRVLYKKDIHDVYIARGSKWGNPFTHIKDKETLATHIVNTRSEAISKYKEWILEQPHLMDALHELKDKRLACYCRLNQSCHGDILIELIEQPEKQYYNLF